MSPCVRHRSSRFWSIGKNLFDSTELDKCVYAVSLKRFDELRLVYVTSISQISAPCVPSFRVDLAGERRCLDQRFERFTGSCKGL